MHPPAGQEGMGDAVVTGDGGGDGCGLWVKGESVAMGNGEGGDGG